MAGFTGLGCNDVRRGFTLRHRPIVASGAARRDAGVVHCGTDKRRGRFVTGLARLRRRNVSGRFALGSRPIVAGRTTRGDAGMVHRRTDKRCRRFVTGFA